MRGSKGQGRRQANPEGLASAMGLLRRYALRNDEDGGDIVRLRRAWLLLFILCSPIVAAPFADNPVATIPESNPDVPGFEQLVIRTGYDFLHSTENYQNDGSLTYQTYLGQYTTFTQNTFWLEGEYGIADGWSALVGVAFAFNNLSYNSFPSTTILSGTGVPGLQAAVKWSVLSGDYPITLEARSMLPTIAPTGWSYNQLTVGNGDLDVAFVAHLGAKVNHLLLSLSPGLLFRSSGYSQAGIVSARVKLDLDRVYIAAFADFIYSFSVTNLQDSSILAHDAPGAGGTYALLSGSPVGLSGGGGVGVKIVKDLAFEGTLSHAIWGERYPAFLQATGNLVIPFDFYVPEKRTKIHQVPLSDP